MDYGDLVDSLLLKLVLILVSIVIINIAFIPIYKKCVKSIIDPLCFALVMTSFADAVPIFLFATKAMKWELFSFILIAESLFWVAFYFSWGLIKEKKYINIIQNEEAVSRFIFRLAFILVICLKTYTYAINGFPVFNDSRFLGLATNQSLVNFLSRFVAPFSLFLNLYAIKMIKSREKAGWLVLCIVLIFAFLDGSKSFILSLVFCYFFYMYFYELKVPKIKVKYLLLLLLTPLLVINVKTNSALEALLFRLIGNGDVYWNAVYNDAINHVFIKNPITNLTHMFWGPFRYILPIGDDKTDMYFVGQEIMLYSSNDSGVPNSRLPILAWVYYRWYGLLFCIIMGCLASFLIKKLPSKIPRGFTMTCVKASFYNCGISLASDGYLAFASLFSILVFYLIIIIFQNKITIKRVKL